MLGDGERDPLERARLQRAVAQLGAQARVAAQRGRRAGEHAEEVRELAGGGERAAQHRHGSFGSAELVVDGKAADGGHGGFLETGVSGPCPPVHHATCLRIVSVPVDASAAAAVCLLGVRAGAACGPPRAVTCPRFRRSTASRWRRARARARAARPSRRCDPGGASRRPGRAAGAAARADERPRRGRGGAATGDLHGAAGAPRARACRRGPRPARRRSPGAARCRPADARRRPTRRGLQVCHVSVLFRALAGLAVGLAQKESRYAGVPAIRPSTWVPRSPWPAIGRMAGTTGNSAVSDVTKGSVADPSDGLTSPPGRRGVSCRRRARRRAP